jgi:hypothetical protein
MKEMTTMSVTAQDWFAFKRAKQEFNNAWQNTKYTRVELPPVDVNRVLRYTVEPACTTTSLTQLWEMETKKAWGPRNLHPLRRFAGPLLGAPRS